MKNTKNKKTTIIAEIGPNHNGSLKKAVYMVKKLASIGVDVIKFQISNPKLVYSDDAFKAEYQKKNDSKKTVFEMSKSIQLSKNSHIKLSRLCKRLGIIYACTAFDLKSLIFLDKIIKVPFFKVASGEIHSFDMIDYIAKRNKPILFSTGMSTFNEIGKTLKRLTRYGNKKVTIMHCVSSYPAKKKSLNLNVIDELRKRFRTKVGYSDHSLGSTACLAAVAKGVSVIEKHVTISKFLKGPDHKASTSIKDFKVLINKIKKLEIILGANTKKFSNNEKNIRKVVRKSLATNKKINKGCKLKEKDVVFKRPGTGISPLDLKKVLGKKFKISKEKNRVIFNKELE